VSASYTGCACIDLLLASTYSNFVVFACLYTSLITVIALNTTGLSVGTDLRENYLNLIVVEGNLVYALLGTHLARFCVVYCTD
jgi:hypothetical protein